MTKNIISQNALFSLLFMRTCSDERSRPTVRKEKGPPTANGHNQHPLKIRMQDWCGRFLFFSKTNITRQIKAICKVKCALL